MEAILALAEKLGAAIGAHERCRALKQAAAAFKADSAAQDLERQYNRAAHALHEKEREGRPLEPAEKRREADLRTQMATHPVIREFVRAQADFRELMQAVNGAIEKHLDLE